MSHGAAVRPKLHAGSPEVGRRAPTIARRVGRPTRPGPPVHEGEPMTPKLKAQLFQAGVILAAGAALIGTAVVGVLAILDRL